LRCHRPQRSNKRVKIASAILWYHVYWRTEYGYLPFAIDRSARRNSPPSSLQKPASRYLSTANQEFRRRFNLHTRTKCPWLTGLRGPVNDSGIFTSI
jgi:hypothetical protein